MRRAERAATAGKERAAVVIQSAVRGAAGRRRARVLRQCQQSAKSLLARGVQGRCIRQCYQRTGSCGGLRRATPTLDPMSPKGAATATHPQQRGDIATPGTVRHTRMQDMRNQLLLAMRARRRNPVDAERQLRACVLPIHAKRNQIFQEKHKIIALRRHQEHRQARLHRHREHILASRDYAPWLASHRGGAKATMRTMAFSNDAHMGGHTRQREVGGGLGILLTVDVGDRHAEHVGLVYASCETNL